MVIEIPFEAVVPIAGSVLALVGGLYGRTLAAENSMLKQQIDTLEQQQRMDMERINDGHESIWKEITCQRESLTQNKEAVIRLNSSIERLNEILPKLEQAMTGKVSTDMCNTIRRSCLDSRKEGGKMPGGMRHDDPPHTERLK